MRAAASRNWGHFWKRFWCLHSIADFAVPCYCSRLLCLSSEVGYIVVCCWLVLTLLASLSCDIFTSNNECWSCCRRMLKYVFVNASGFNRFHHRRVQLVDAHFWWIQSVEKNHAASVSWHCFRAYSRHHVLKLIHIKQETKESIIFVVITARWHRYYALSSRYATRLCYQSTSRLSWHHLSPCLSP